MALSVPTRQFYPTSFFDSFQSSRVSLFFRYSSSFSINGRPVKFYKTPREEQPLKKVKQHVSQSWYRDKNPKLSGGNWIGRWTRTHQANPPKKPLDAEGYPSESDDETRPRTTPPRPKQDSSFECEEADSRVGTVEKIVEKLKRFGYMDGEAKPRRVEKRIEKGSMEDIFYFDDQGPLPNTSGGFSEDYPFGVPGEARFPWEKRKPKMLSKREEKKERTPVRPTMAELTLPEPEIRRLRYLTLRKKHKTRVGPSGITQEVVDMVHEKWKTSEIARLKIEGTPGLNMRRMHDMLESKTGGMVVWRSGTSLSLYRGVNYESPESKRRKRLLSRPRETSIQTVIPEPPQEVPEVSSETKIETDSQENELESISEEKLITATPSQIDYDEEMDKILDTIGPRYLDWPGIGPKPVDANLLPVPNYRPPFRILPYGVRRSLSNKEATSLKRLARFLPPHFALGRTRQLEGLCAAMIKLWEKSSIAKISLKRGVPLLGSERMAEELKKMTGGILLCRNKFFLVFYRGKDFLSPEVTKVLVEQQSLVKSMQDKEEEARLRASAIMIPNNVVAKRSIRTSRTIGTDQIKEKSITTGTLEESLEAIAKWGKKLDTSHKKKVFQQAELNRHADLVRRLEKKLVFAEQKLAKAEHALSKVEAFLQPADRQSDPDSITEEERFMFRKLGMRMKAFLLIGRRGVFDGTVENMHLHWKYRELVKIIINAKTFEHVKGIALALEAESGGVLVSVDRISKKKFAVVVYRGREYQRPSILRPKNLLTKRKALARSIEIQRQQALQKHISGVKSKVDQLRSELEQMNEIKDQGDESYYNKLDFAYPTSEDESEEEEDDEAYLGTYKIEDGIEDEDNVMIQNLYEENSDLEPEDEQLDSLSLDEKEVEEEEDANMGIVY